MRRAGQAIRCMVLCRHRFSVSEVGNQVFLITLRLDCRWIRSPVESPSNNHHAQQKCRDLDFHRLAPCPRIRRQTALLAIIPTRTLPEGIFRSTGPCSKCIRPCSFDARNAMGGSWQQRWNGCELGFRLGEAISRARDQTPQRLAVWSSPRIRRTQLVVRAKLIRRAGRPCDRPGWRAARGCSRPTRRRAGARRLRR